MHFLLGLISFFLSFNSPVNILPLERHILKIVSGENSVLIISPQSMGLYSAINDSMEYLPLDNIIYNAVNIEGTDTYLLFGRNNIYLFNRFLYLFNKISTTNHTFYYYHGGNSIYLKDVTGTVFLLNMNALIPADTDFTDWEKIKTTDDIKNFPELLPYYIAKGNNIYHYTSAVRFHHKIFAGTDNFGFFIIDKYTGEKKHILNGITGDLKGVISSKNSITFFSDSDIAIIKNHRITFLLDTLFFYPHFYDNISYVSIHNDTIYFSGDNSIYYIKNEGIYKIVNSSFRIHSFLFHKDTLYYATDNGVVKTWGDKNINILPNVATYDIIRSERFFFFATEKGIYVLNNNKVTKMKQFPNIAYKELAINDVAIAAVSDNNESYFMTFSDDSVTYKRINAPLLKGNLYSLDSQIVYIEGNSIYDYPGHNIFPLSEYDITGIKGVQFLHKNAYLFEDNAILFMPVNDIFPFLSHR